MLKRGDLLTISQVIQIVPTSRSSLYRLRKKDPRLMRKLGNRVFIDMAVLETMMATTAAESGKR